MFSLKVKDARSGERIKKLVDYNSLIYHEKLEANITFIQKIESSSLRRYGSAERNC